MKHKKKISKSTIIIIAVAVVCVLAVVALCLFAMPRTAEVGGAVSTVSTANTANAASNSANATNQPAATNQNAVQAEPAPKPEPATDSLGWRPGETSDASFADLQQKIEAYNQQWNCEATFTLINLETGKGFNIDGDKPMVAASVIKLLVMAELFDQVDQGILSLDDYKDGDTLRHLCEIMIYQSSDPATNSLIEVVGMDNINEEAQKLGLQNTVLNRMMISVDDSATIENYMSSNDTAVILNMIWEGNFYSPELNQLALQFLEESEDIYTGVYDAIPPSATWAHKAGVLYGYIEIRNDCGIMEAPTPFVMCIYTHGLNESSGRSYRFGLTQIVYSWMEG
ncbi:MAG: serine hydrolase [Coriobacteriia bacterium]|nr:serine hydrolase [Coriobacteriia bacterium]